jgi:hypothetical protein
MRVLRSRFNVRDSISMFFLNRKIQRERSV